MNINEATSFINEKIKNLSKTPFVIAIDGKCAAGKTTFSNMLKKEIDCNVIHTDYFFLRPEQRTKERYEEPGGNIDRERLIEEVMIPLSQGLPFSYQVFDCKLMALSEKIHINPKAATIIEGSYSCHPQLWDYYDLRIFFDTAKENQINRIIKRNGIEAANNFKNKWIPLEEKYFKAFNIKERCDLIIEN